MDIIEFLLLSFTLVICYGLGLVVKRYLEQQDVTIGDGLGTIEGSLLALFAFFLGFTFSISASKIETVRATSVNESNAIGTALLRIDLYEDEHQSQFKALFKDYLDSRVDYFASSNAEEDNILGLEKSLEKSQLIWNFAVELQKTNTYESASRLMIPALNDMIDAVSSRDSAISARLPNAIIYTLYALCMLSCFIVGFSTKRKVLGYLVGIIYIVIIALTVNLIIDASNPRSGYINTDKANQGIIDLRNSIQ